jgi:ATP-dependent protease ClpP protease subunit
MADIIISGEIGWEVRASDIREQFNNVESDQDITIDLSSPGGSVFQGVQIGHMIRDHQGKTTVIVSAAALSMGSHIMQNADVIKVHDDTAFMMHNPWMYTAGDYIELQKDVDLLKSLAGMLSVRYAENSGQEKKAIRKLMNNTTWLFGQEIVDAGFAHEVIETKDPESKEDAIAFAKLEYEECLTNLKKYEGNADDAKQIAAMLITKNIPTITSTKTNTINNKTTTKPAKPVSKTRNHEENMTFEEFCAKYPDEAARITAWLEAEKAPDVSAMTLSEILALSETAKTEHETALADARKTIEDDKLTAEQVKKVFAVCSSPAYAALASIGPKVLIGEKDFSSFEDMVVMADQQIATLKAQGLIKEQPDPTPGSGGLTEDQIKQAKTKAAAKGLSDAINNTENKVQ